MARNLFVGVGHNGIRLVSEDGQHWGTPQFGKEGEVYRAVGFGNGVCTVAGTYGGSNIFAVRQEGEAWKTEIKDAGYSRFVRGMTFGQGRFFGYGGDGGSVGDSRPFVTDCADGTNWTPYRDISGKFLIRRVAFGGGLFVGVGDRGRRSVSSDGRDWKDVANTRALDTLVDVAFGNGMFVGVGLHGLRMTTTDGVKWSAAIRGEEGEHLNSIIWTGDRFVAVGMGATYLSPDGKSWKRQPNKNAPLTVAYGNGKFVGAQWKGRLLFSTDAIEWKETIKCESHIEALAFGSVG